jgi:hypothetical protein
MFALMVGRRKGRAKARPYTRSEQVNGGIVCVHRKSQGCRSYQTDAERTQSADQTSRITGRINGRLEVCLLM